ncbi:hypothetical protein PCPL58_p6020 (plasmid) [Pseudomonas cerasi]|uniref:DUF4158 domain-containing protein n=1 Tax=Pseudomonas cerasi TaxID=1583341 RepID=A0A193SHA9_9PSED|nr:hypothetical protein PCPL58_p6020 [Pseudomonas cerasi]SOS30511.1 hypothetical protein PL963_P600007 [Pseudomonas cerasi]
MPRRLILSASERDTLLALPDSQDDLIRYYTFNESDLSLIRQRRGDANRLGFAIQLCLLRYPGYRRASALACGVAIKRRHLRLQLGPGHQLFKVSQEAISASLLFLAGIFEFGEGLLHARNAHGEGGWLRELSVPRVGTVGYFCSASLGVAACNRKPAGSRL